MGRHTIPNGERKLLMQHYRRTAGEATALIGFRDGIVSLKLSYDLHKTVQKQYVLFLTLRSSLKFYDAVYYN